MSKNNNIPPYILCSTPALARQVLEKIERESDTSFNSGLKPTSFFVEDWAVRYWSNNGYDFSHHCGPLKEALQAVYQDLKDNNYL